jgi:outer membrane biosynthesis protein TonB
MRLGRLGSIRSGRLAKARRWISALASVLLLLSVVLPFYKTYGDLYPKGWVSLAELVASFLAFIPEIGFANALQYTASVMYLLVFVLLIVGATLTALKGRIGALLGLAAVIMTTVGSYGLLYRWNFHAWSLLWAPALSAGYYAALVGTIMGVFAVPFIAGRKRVTGETAVEAVPSEVSAPSPRAPSVAQASKAPSPPPMPAGIVVSPTITVTQHQVVKRPPRPEEYPKASPRPKPPRPEEEESRQKPAEAKVVVASEPIREAKSQLAEKAETAKALPMQKEEDTEPIAQVKPSEETGSIDATQRGMAEEVKTVEGSKLIPEETTPDAVVAAIGALKRRQESGSITMDVLRAELGKLMFTDPSDKYWTIDFRTGKWVWHDGVKWVEGTPPSMLKDAGSQ